MQHVSRWTVVVAALCLTAACADSTATTAPVVPVIAGGISGDITSAACQAELDALSAAIAGAAFTGKNAGADRINLALKVDATQAKLVEGKSADAFVKLEDIRATVLALSTLDEKGKIKLEAGSAAAIIAAVDAAEACVSTR